jgi:hypothetical protein
MKLKEANAKKKRELAKKHDQKKSFKLSDNDDDVADDDDMKGKSQGKNLSTTNKLMICKAYIATS